LALCDILEEFRLGPPLIGTDVEATCWRSNRFVIPVEKHECEVTTGHPVQSVDVVSSEPCTDVIGSVDWSRKYR
jgi:hypothetical protein